MLIFAVSALDKARELPRQFWINVGLAFLIFFATVFVIRMAAKMNKAVLGAIIFIVCTIVGIQWIYERNEPAFLTPVVDKIAPFLPSKGMYEGKTTADPLKKS